MDVRNAGPERYDDPDYDRMYILRIILRCACGVAVVLFLFLMLVFVI